MGTKWFCRAYKIPKFSEKIIVDIDTLMCAFNRVGNWLISMEVNDD